MIPRLNQEVEAVAPDLSVYDLKTMEEHLATALLPARLVALAVGVIGALSVVLLGVGIYGFVSYSVAQRTREVGIRVALGAQPRGVIRAVMAEETRPVVAGVLGGLVAVLILAGWLQKVLYSRALLDPPVWVGAPLLLAAVALTSVYLAASKAAAIDPARSLRSE